MITQETIGAVIEAYGRGEIELETVGSDVAKRDIYPKDAQGLAAAKSYTLGTVAGTTTAATNDRFKRHVFGTDVRLMNLGGRKEIPE